MIWFNEVSLALVEEWQGTGIQTSGYCNVKMTVKKSGEKVKPWYGTHLPYCVPFRVGDVQKRRPFLSVFTQP